MLLAVTIGNGFSVAALLLLSILLSIGPLILCHVVIRASDAEYSNDVNRETWRNELMLRAAFSFPAAAVLLTVIALIVGMSVYNLPFTKEKPKEWTNNEELRSTN